MITQRSRPTNCTNCDEDNTENSVVYLHAPTINQLPVYRAQRQIQIASQFITHNCTIVQGENAMRMPEWSCTYNKIKQSSKHNIRMINSGQANLWLTLHRNCIRTHYTFIAMCRCSVYENNPDHSTLQTMQQAGSICRMPLSMKTWASTKRAMRTIALLTFSYTSAQCSKYLAFLIVNACMLGTGC